MLQVEFRMGVPFHDDDFHNYLHALTRAYKRMHSNGVGHLDGYPSNILWRKSSEEEIVISFVDLMLRRFLATISILEFANYCEIRRFPEVINTE